MKSIAPVKLLTIILALMMSVPPVYAIKSRRIKKPNPPHKVTQSLRKKNTPRKPISPRTTRTISPSTLEREVNSGVSTSRTPSRPLQNFSLSALERGVTYMFKPLKSMTQNDVLQIVENTSHEISMRVQEFVAERGRWMEGSTRGSRSPFQSEAAWNKYTVKGVTEEEIKLANLATQVMLYGDEKYPAVTQLIELYESFNRAGKKGLIDAMREVIKFSQREDDLLRAGIYNPEFMTEGKKLLKEMTDRMPEHVYHGDDLVLKQCYKLIANMQERNSYRYHLNLLEDFIAREGRIPQTYGWNGKDQTRAQYSAAQQQEYGLYATVKRLMSQYPAGENTFVDRIRQLWKQYGAE